MASLLLTTALACFTALPALAQDRVLVRDDGSTAPAPLVLPQVASRPQLAAEHAPDISPFPIAGEAIADDGSTILVYHHGNSPAPEAPGQVTTTFASSTGAAGNMFDL